MCEQMNKCVWLPETPARLDEFRYAIKHVDNGQTDVVNNAIPSLELHCLKTSNIYFQSKTHQALLVLYYTQKFLIDSTAKRWFLKHHPVGHLAIVGKR